MGKLTGKDRKEYKKLIFEATHLIENAKSGKNPEEMVSALNKEENLTEKFVCKLKDWTPEQYLEADAEEIMTAEKKIEEIFGLKKN